MEKCVVVGLTGATRCGKSWTASLLAELLRVPPEHIIGQDSYWRREVPVKLASGKVVPSQEEPHCTDHDAFATAIHKAIAAAEAKYDGNTCPVVIAEGFQLLHSPRVRELLTHVWLLELDMDECINRRSAPKSKRNLHPISKSRCEQLVWPAHLRYLSDDVAPCGDLVQRRPAISTEENAQALASEIASVVMC